MSRTGRFAYVGAPRSTGPVGAVIRDRAGLVAWIGSQPAPDRREPFTYVVDLDGFLRLAPRRGEHVACAGGAEVLGAGEITFDGARVVEVSNHSAGYCPDLDSWEAVALALDRLRVTRPRGFTSPIVFRRCRRCDEANIVRDGDFTCALCDARLPPKWNFDPPP